MLASPVGLLSIFHWMGPGTVQAHLTSFNSSPSPLNQAPLGLCSWRRHSARPGQNHRVVVHSSFSYAVCWQVPLICLYDVNPKQYSFSSQPHSRPRHPSLDLSYVVVPPFSSPAIHHTPSLCGGFSCCGAQVLGCAGSVVRAQGVSSYTPQVLEHGLSSGARALLPHGMWNLPRPGIKPASPALVVRFLTTGLPGKPSCVCACPLPGHFRGS